MAIREYDEACLRNPDDARVYSNRAACYLKLMEFERAVKDCDECVRLDPTFAKGYLRKGNALLAMQRNDEAGTAFRKALELEPDNAEARQGLGRTMQDTAGLTREERAARAAKNPEVIAVLQDPAMQAILQQMQEDPKAASECVGERVYYFYFVFKLITKQAPQEPGGARQDPAARRQRHP